MPHGADEVEPICFRMESIAVAESCEYVSAYASAIAGTCCNWAISSFNQRQTVPRRHSTDAAAEAEQSVLSRTIASTATLKLANMHALDPFYTPLEERFERITRLARRALGTRVAAITVVEGERQWFKSVIGWQVTELPISDSPCVEVLRSGRPSIISNTLDDLHLMNNRYVHEHPRFRFYAGYPIFDSSGATVGTFCALDTCSRRTDASFATALSDLGELAQRELFALELNRAQSEIVAKLDRARRQAMFDPLTRLWNRRGGLDLLTTALQDAVNSDRPLGVCVADIDNFKQVNDQFGHRIGDHVLRRAASSIVASVRPDDIVCRFGGEEFLVVIRDVDEPTCMAIARRIREGIRGIPVWAGKTIVPATFSIGVAIRQPNESISPSRLIERADQALYRSKQEGKDRVTIGRD